MTDRSTATNGTVRRNCGGALDIELDRVSERSGVLCAECEQEALRSRAQAAVVEVESIAAAEGVASKAHLNLLREGR